MAAAASEGASSGDANDDAVPGRCCEQPLVGRVGRVGPDAWAGLRAAALSVASDANS